MLVAGADPGFQVRGGAHLKKLRRAEGGAKFFGVFRVKNHDFTQKIIFFPILGGARAGCAPPWIRPCYIADKTALTVRHSSFTLHEYISTVHSMA